MTEHIAPFDVALSNPPYQQQSEGTTTVANLFHRFQQNTLLIANATSMIYPGGRWLQGSGNGVKTFGKHMLSSPHLQRIDYYPYHDVRQKLFPNITLKDGASIVHMDTTRDNHGTFMYNGRDTTLPPEGILVLDTTLVPMIEQLAGFPRIRDRVMPRTLFHIESDFVEHFPERVEPVIDATPPPHMTAPVKLFTNNRAGPSGRGTWYWIEERHIPAGHEFLHRWKLIAPSAIQGSETAVPFAMAGAGTAFARSRLLIMHFDTAKELENAYQYCSTPLIQSLFVASMSGKLAEFGAFVPDLEDYTNANPLFMSDAQLPEGHEYLALSLEERLVKFFGIEEVYTPSLY